MKKSISLFLCILSILLLSGCVNVFKLADLKPDGYNFPNNKEKAQQLMKDMGAAHRIHMWDSLETYAVTFEDEFYGFFGKLSNPFKEQKIELYLNYIPHTSDGQLKILTGKEQGAVWGVQSLETYTKNETGQIIKEKNKNLNFWIPVFQYFIEFPSRIQDASSVDYIGSKVINGIQTEGIIASWNSIDKQKDIDQYLIWIDANTKRIIKIEYTVRESARFVTGEASFLNYKEYNGMILPSELPVTTNLTKNKLLHTMRINDFKANPLPIDMLMPLK